MSEIPSARIGMKTDSEKLGTYQTLITETYSTLYSIETGGLPGLNWQLLKGIRDKVGSLYDMHMDLEGALRGDDELPSIIEKHPRSRGQTINSINSIVTDLNSLKTQVLASYDKLRSPKKKKEFPGTLKSLEEILERWIDLVKTIN